MKKRRANTVFATIIVIAATLLICLPITARSARKSREPKKITEEISEIEVISGDLTFKNLVEKISFPFELKKIESDATRYFYLDGLYDGFSNSVEGYFEEKGLNFSSIEEIEDYEDFLSSEDFFYLSEFSDLLLKYDESWVEVSDFDLNSLKEFFDIRLTASEKIESESKNSRPPAEYFPLSDLLSEFLTSLNSDVILEEE